ncbi:MAG TPA: branched-chain amino acid transaminase [Candidatus Acetothermia bacterium]|nr:branched-chain amino acid transaminase [Candidatus Acetothermia bacterium]
MSGGNRFAFFRGKIVPIEEAKVSIMTSAFNYGSAVFEGIRGYWNQEQGQLYLFRLREHMVRLLQNCRLLLIELPYSADQLCQIAVELVQREGFKTDIYLRPLAYKSSPVVGVRLHDLESDCAMFAVPFGEYLNRPAGARVMVSSWRRLADNAIPPRGKITGTYVNPALAKTEAALHGFDDAIMLCQDGHVSEASTANLFLVRQGTLITPPVTADILEGITRGTVLRLAEDLGIRTMERTVDRSELYVAEEVFMCGTALGMVAVVEVDGRPIGDGTPGPVFTRLNNLFRAIVRGKEPRYLDWCTPVYPAPPPAG